LGDEVDPFRHAELDPGIHLSFLFQEFEEDGSRTKSGMTIQS
jgi:hypothetical protein